MACCHPPEVTSTADTLGNDVHYWRGTNRVEVSDVQRITNVVLDEQRGPRARWHPSRSKRGVRLERVNSTQSCSNDERASRTEDRGSPRPKLTLLTVHLLLCRIGPVPRQSSA